MNRENNKGQNYIIVEPERSSQRSNDQSPKLIFGLNPVLEALKSERRQVDQILIQEGMREARLHEILYLAKQKGVPFQNVHRDKISGYFKNNENHQGILAFTASTAYYNADKLIEEITSKENSLSVILDGIEDPRNLGAILRSVECSGADGVFIPERRAVGLTETVAKSSAGATEYVKVAKVTNLSRLIEELKANNIWVIGASGDAKMDYTEWDWKQSSTLVLGSEGKGLHRLVAEKCDVLVKIPMQGNIESLNVSVASGVILFEAIRQRSSK